MPNYPPVLNAIQFPIIGAIFVEKQFDLQTRLSTALYHVNLRLTCACVQKGVNEEKSLLHPNRI